MAAIAPNTINTRPSATGTVKEAGITQEVLPTACEGGVVNFTTGDFSRTQIPTIINRCTEYFSFFFAFIAAAPFLSFRKLQH